MKGVTDLYFSHKIDELCDILEFAIKRPQSVSTKIDGKPALFMWSSFPGLRGPGVGFKKLLDQLKKGSQLGTYFTSEQEIDEYLSKSERTEGFIKHRGDSFKCALKMAPYVAPGHILWGDVLFTPGEIKSVGGLFSCTPNTIEYQIDPKVFPQVKSANFGIFLHTDIDGKLGTQTIKNLSKLLTYKGEMVLQPSDLVPETDLSTSELMSELDRLRQDGQECRDLMEANDILRTTCRRLVNKIDLNLTQKIEQLPNKYKEDGAKVITNAMGFINLKEYILNNTSIHGIKSLINGERSNGEGYVIDMPGHEPLKLVSDIDFTAFNKIHMAYSRMNERIIDDGQTVLAWSSSKDTQLFNYYLGKNLRYGDNGGSNYGFATYCVTEPPFTDAAQVGYSDEYRRKLYGDNIFEFKIPTDKIVFFDYQDYLKSKQGQKQQASFNDFVRVQLKSLGVRMTEEEYQSLQPVDEKKPTASVAVKLYQIMSRYFYQGHRGNLRTPIDGFQYRGRNDGNTLVVWNSNRLVPVRYSNDLGQTWQDCDSNSEVYKEYIKSAQNANYAYNEPKYKNSIFDGKKTPEKKEIYRLLMKYNSNDGTDSKGKSLGLSDGIFYNIKIKDDKKIDASFKFNLPYVDYGEHFFRLRKNQFLDQIFNKGYRFGTLDCGLKIGSEHNPNETWESVEDRWWPEEVTGGFKLVCLPINKRQFKYQTKFGQKKLYLTKCHIEEDVFDGWEVILDPEKPNFCKKEVKDQLTKKYDWAYNLTEEEPLMESAIKKYRLEEARQQLDEETKSLILKIVDDNNLELMNKSNNKMTETVSDINDATVNNSFNQFTVFVRRKKENPLVGRYDAIQQLKSYAKTGELDFKIFDIKFDKYVYTSINGVTVVFRFRLTDSENKRSNSTKLVEEQENAFAYLISKNYTGDYNFTKDELKNLLSSQGLTLINEWYDNNWYNSLRRVPKLIRDFMIFDTSNLIAVRSEKTDIANKLNVISKKFFAGYKYWNTADIWVYKERDKKEIYDILDKCSKIETLSELNDTFIGLLIERKFVGVSLKKKDLSIVRPRVQLANVYGEEELTENNTLESITGLHVTSMSIKTKWAHFIYRSPNVGDISACTFNIPDKGSQSAKCSFNSFQMFDSFKNVFTPAEFSKIMKEGLTQEQLKKFSLPVLASNLVDAKSKSVVQNWYDNPSIFFNQDPIIVKINSQHLAIVYMLLMNPEELRNEFCNKLWLFCRRKQEGQGPYVYVG